jgi:PAS domain S-box-containing protein
MLVLPVIQPKGPMWVQAVVDSILLGCLAGPLLWWRYLRLVDAASTQTEIFKLIAKHARNSVVLTDAQGRIEWANEAFTRQSGYELVDVVGRTPRILKSGLHDRSFYQQLWNTIRAGETWSGEIHNRHKNGSVYTEEMNIIPLCSANGRVQNYVALKYDLTERLRAQLELEQAHRDLETKVEDRTAELTRANHELQSEIDERRRAVAQLNQSKENTEISNRSLLCLEKISLTLLTCQSLEELAQFVSQALVESFGAYFARIWLKRPADLCSNCAVAEHCPAKTECLHLIFSAGHYTHIDGDHRRVPLGVFKIGRIAQGSGRTISNDVINDERIHNREWAAQHGLKSFAGLPLRRGNEVIGVVAMFSQNALHPRVVEVFDLLSHTIVSAITNIQQREAVASASRAKSDFLATMSHELRTPLNGVIGMTELLLGTNLDAQQRRFAWLAKSSGDALLSLINDILDFSKIESGKLELEDTDFDVHYAVETIAASLSSPAEGKGLELMTAVHPAVPRLVRGDPGRLQQILTNLVSNAIKFTEKGEVVIRVTLEEELEQQIMVRFAVNDTGIGIPTDRLSRLFVSFSQVDSSTTRKYGGTGLGLAICKQLVDLMGGQIGVISEEGKGTTFWFTVSLKKQPSDGSPTRAINGDLRCLRVLVVDDNATNREILTEQLASWRLEHQTAADGGQALALLRASAAVGTPFDLAILDMQMPGMNGRELAKAIKADAQIQNTVLVLLTSSQEDFDNSQLRAGGIAGYAVKPVRQSQLIDILAEAMVCATSPSEAGHQIGSVNQATPCLETLRCSKTARILLAEDHPISQELATTLLRKAGYHCDAVADGRQALEAVLGQPYDLVLMDCQMPVMDGFTATQAIRQAEQTGQVKRGSKGRLPIIALTANAIQGDRERCFDAGMDDYLTKPLNADKLVSLIKSQLARDAPAHLSERGPELVTIPTPDPGGPPAMVPTPMRPAFDLERLLKQWGGDKTLILSLIPKFNSQAQKELEQIEQSIAAANAEQTRQLAHGLKGSASYLCASGIRELAAKLEVMGREGDLSEADTLLMKLRGELQRCVDFLPDTATDTTESLAGIGAQDANSDC